MPESLHFQTQGFIGHIASHNEHIPHVFRSRSGITGRINLPINN